MNKVKLVLVLAFLVFGGATLFTNNEFLTVVSSFSGGPPPGVTGAPGEATCTDCHLQHVGPGMFSITAPANYVPGQTYVITVQHATTDMSRMRWGFELTALANFTAAGTFSNTGTFTQTLADNGRFYIEHTSPGTFFGQHDGAQWTFEWIAPPVDLGAVTFYAAGNQAMRHQGRERSGNTELLEVRMIRQLNHLDVSAIRR